MNTLDSLMVNVDEGTRTGVPLRPNGVDVLNLRHNGQTGMLTVQFPTQDKNEQGQEVNAKSYEFIPLFITKLVKSGRGISSNPTLSGTGFFDLYRYEDTNKGRVSYSLGIYTGKAAKEQFASEGVKIYHRIFGLLTKKDNKLINSEPDLADFSKANDNIVLAYLELSPQKYFALAEQLHVKFDEVADTIAGQFLKVEEFTSRSDKTYFAFNSNGGAFVPKFSLKEMTKEKDEKLHAKAKNILNLIATYSDQIEKNDQMLSKLIAHNLVKANTIEKLGNLGIVDDKSLTKFLGQPEDWSKIVSVLNDQPVVDTNSTATENETKKEDYSSFLDNYTDNKPKDDFISNDDLPF